MTNEHVPSHQIALGERAGSDGITVDAQRVIVGLPGIGNVIRVGPSGAYAAVHLQENAHFAIVASNLLNVSPRGSVAFPGDVSGVVVHSRNVLLLHNHAGAGSGVAYDISIDGTAAAFISVADEAGTALQDGLSSEALATFGSFARCVRLHATGARIHAFTGARAAGHGLQLEGKDIQLTNSSIGLDGANGGDGVVILGSNTSVHIGVDGVNSVSQHNTIGSNDGNGISIFGGAVSLFPTLVGLDRTGLAPASNGRAALAVANDVASTTFVRGGAYVAFTSPVINHSMHGSLQVERAVLGGPVSLLGANVAALYLAHDSSNGVRQAPTSFLTRAHAVIVSTTDALTMLRHCVIAAPTSSCLAVDQQADGALQLLHESNELLALREETYIAATCESSTTCSCIAVPSVETKASAISNAHVAAVAISIVAAIIVLLLLGTMRLRSSSRTKGRLDELWAPGFNVASVRAVERYAIQYSHTSHDPVAMSAAGAAGKEASVAAMQRMSFPRHLIQLDGTVLGEGHYGRVLRGKLSIGQGVSINKSVTSAGRRNKNESLNFSSASEADIPCAVKEATGTGIEPMTDILVEACLLRTFEHPNVVRLLGICAEVSPLWLVMEYCEGGDLRRRLQALEVGRLLPRSEADEALQQSWATPVERAHLPMKDMLTVLLQVSRALVHLHARTCVHRDLAARNVLLKRRPVMALGFAFC